MGVGMGANTHTILQLASWLILFAWSPADLAGAPQKQMSRSPHGQLAVACENCHTATAWKPIRAVPEFDHNKTRYPLRGMHEKVPCVQCHVKPVFTDVGKNCQDCHVDVHQRKMGANCAECHTVQGWNIAVEQLRTHQNRFPLAGAHAAVQCDACHKGAAVGQFLGLSTACSSCHLADYNNTTAPPHAQLPALYPIANCGTCHKFDSWLGAQFDHSLTGFVLEGTHYTTPCLSCHINNNFKLVITQNDCGNAQCHLTKWQQTTNPPHPVAAAQAGNYFSFAYCYRCHDTVSWTNYYFNHTNTGFPLYSSHQMVPNGYVTLCSQCHVNNNYTLTTTPSECISCHLADWNKTMTLGGNVPNHIAANFPPTYCSSCHDAISFLDNGFNHQAMSAIVTGTAGWALTGSHQLSPVGKVTACTDCHVGNAYSLTAANTDCYGCHVSYWTWTATLGGNIPNHVAGNFPTWLCPTCHDTVSFLDNRFDHFAISAAATGTGWALVGSHQLAPAGKVTDCTWCHVGSNYGLTTANTVCDGCHDSAYTSAQTWGPNVPNHVTAGFPTALCPTCHDTISFLDGKFDHSTTGWPLQGPHTLPPHPAVTGAVGAMVNACTDCHGTTWQTFTTAQTDCYYCHQWYFQNAQTYGATVPNHVTSGYVTTCVTCHTTWVTTAWLGAKVAHPNFKIPHQNSVCADCHVNPKNYSTFSCVSACHSGNAGHTNLTKGTIQHKGVSGYVRSATTCVNCHKS